MRSGGLALAQAPLIFGYLSAMKALRQGFAHNWKVLTPDFDPNTNSLGNFGNFIRQSVVHDILGIGRVTDPSEVHQPKSILSIVIKSLCLLFLVVMFGATFVSQMPISITALGLVTFGLGALNVLYYIYLYFSGPESPSQQGKHIPVRESAYYLMYAYINRFAHWAKGKMIKREGRNPKWGYWRTFAELLITWSITTVIVLGIVGFFLYPARKVWDRLSPEVQSFLLPLKGEFPAMITLVYASLIALFSTSGFIIWYQGWVSRIDKCYEIASIIAIRILLSIYALSGIENWRKSVHGILMAICSGVIVLGLVITNNRAKKPSTRSVSQE